MKIDYTYYKKDLLLNVYNDKANILEYINKSDSANYEEVLKKDKRASVYKALSNISENIVRWYEFSDNSNVLEIGAGLGEITGALCDMNNKVTSIVFSKEDATAISNRWKSKTNLEIICGELKNINLDKKYEYITLFNVLENANKIIEDDSIKNIDAVKKILEFAKENLKENGKILIATNNKFGIKNFAGSKYSKDYYSFSSITGNESTDFPIHMSKKELVSVLNNTGLLEYNFFYPLPDYRLTNVIFSDKYLPCCENSKLKYNLYYSEFENILFDEYSALKQLVNEDKFPFFANSFFVEVGSNNVETKFVGFNNIRKSKYRLITKMNNKYIKKTMQNKEGIHQIKKIENNLKTLKALGFSLIDEVKENTVISKYMDNLTLDNYLVTLIRQNKITEAKKEIEKFFVYISNKLIDKSYIYKSTIFDEFKIDVSSETLSSFNIVEKGFIDLVFENTFLENNDYVFYDQEWYELNVPIEFILYRAINNLYYYNNEINKKIPKNVMLKEFGVFDFVELFEKLENSWQSKITDENIADFYSNSNKNITNLETVVSKNKQLEIKVKMYEQDNSILKIELNNMKYINNIQENKIKELQKSIDNMLNSKSWRYTKIFRK
ncbi:MAG: methyltransferase [Clostridia bacterium]